MDKIVFWVCVGGFVTFLAYGTGLADGKAYRDNCHCVVQKKWGS